MSNRVSGAIFSRRARENIVKLLFGGSNTSTSIPIDAASMAGDIDRHNHKNRRRKRYDTSNNSTGTNVKRHSYSQLRLAYLDKVHSMHPDKLQHNQIQNKEDVHIQFIELKNAWEEYHASVRIVQRKSNDKSIQSLDNNDDDDYLEEDGDDFTLFGVGCSFADSQAERDQRNKIMDQASRGWFSSGSISVANKDTNDDDTKDESSYAKLHLTKEIQLSDDNMFISTADQSTSEDSPIRRKCLVDNVDIFRKKR